MNFGLGLLLIVCIDAIVVACGYAVAGWFRQPTPAVRLLVAPLLGLGLLLWSVSAVNLALPFRGPGAWLCLWPLAVTLAVPRLRRALGGDLAAGLRRADARAILLGGAILTLLLIFPFLRDAHLVFFDGTSNHDNFFWISSADFLQRHTYLESPVRSALYPVYADVSAIIGWQPLWGRMGAEGLIALVAGILRLNPLRLYTFATITLLLPWLAALFLLARETGLRPKSPLLLGLAAALQPLFVFFQANGNLPNLFGAIFAAALLLGAAGLRSSATRGLGFVLCLISVHALLCSYPEIIPFAALPVALFALAVCLRPASGENRWRLPALLLAAAVAGLALNPATTLRAAHGFMVSFSAARGSQHWANLFASLTPAGYVPGFVTLAIRPNHLLGWSGGLVFTALLAVSGVLIFRAARDRRLLLCSLAGFAALILYTVATGFTYGWQKSVQFAAIPLAVLYPGGALDAWGRQRAVRRRLALAALAGLAGFFVYAQSGLLAESYRRARDKGLTGEMLTLRDSTAARFPDRPVLVQSRTFAMSFFHGMWAAYLFAKNPVYFSARDPQAGGYLRQNVLREDPAHPAARAACAYVGRDWADTFDANCPPLAADRIFALLPVWNRVGRLEGVYPADGVPAFAAPRFALDLAPRRPATLSLALASRYGDRQARTAEVSVTAPDGRTQWRTTLAWQPGATLALDVPLAAGTDNQVNIRILPDAAGAPADDRPFPFAFKSIRVLDRAAP